jgi:autotransporter passenger strand-loop-strand repeat protein
MAVISGTVVSVTAGQSSSGDVVVAGGVILVYSGGSIASTVAADHGSVTIYSGGSATGTTMLGSGFVDDEGTAIGDLIANGGAELVFGGGVTSGATVFTGGIENVEGLSPGDTGRAVGMTVNGGLAGVWLGGTVSGTDIINGGVLDVNGGTADKTSVGASGTLNVSSGGVVSALRINDPNDPAVSAEVQVASGGTVDGATRINGGQLILDAGADFQAHAGLTIMNSGWLILEQDSFNGTIRDFGGSDELDLTRIRFNGATETFTPSGTGGTLQVQQGSHVADLHLAGAYSTANFTLASDGAHGTLVSFVP